MGHLLGHAYTVYIFLEVHTSITTLNPTDFLSKYVCAFQKKGM